MLDTSTRRIISAAWNTLAYAVSGRRNLDGPSSSSYEIVSAERARGTLADAAKGGTAWTGWDEAAVAEQQDATYRALLADMHAGAARADFLAAAEAVRRTGVSAPSVLEVGCGSGYYAEILASLTGLPLRYVGLDASRAMTRLAHERYPRYPFVAGDATALPFADSAFDLVMNGVSLMHIMRYEAAVAESRRVARRWCIFHTVPLLARKPTTFLRKSAYGTRVPEVILNEEELRLLLAREGMAVRHVLPSIPYDLHAVLGEATRTATFVCEIAD